jgi:hypothetical protein
MLEMGKPRPRVAQGCTANFLQSQNDNPGLWLTVTLYQVDQMKVMSIIQYIFFSILTYMKVGKIGHLSHNYRNKSFYFITFLFFFKLHTVLVSPRILRKTIEDLALFLRITQLGSKITPL